MMKISKVSKINRLEKKKLKKDYEKIIKIFDELRPSIKEIIFVRHFESIQYHDESYFGRINDTEIDESKIEKIEERTADVHIYLNDSYPAFVSSAKRCHQTAEIYGIPECKELELHPFSSGMHEKSSIEAVNKYLAPDFWKNPNTFTKGLFGAETILEQKVRVISKFTSFIQHNPEIEKFILVSHSSIFNIIEGVFNKKNDKEILKDLYHFEYGGVYKFSKSSGSWEINQLS